MPMFSNDNHLHQVTYELNGVRSLLSEILFYFVFFATIYVGIQIGRFIFHHFLQPMNNNEDIDLLYQRLMVTEQSVEALISHLNRLREEQVNVFDSAPTHVSHPTTPVRSKGHSTPKGSSTPEGRRPKKNDVEKALPESASDSGESEESKKDV